VFIKDDLEVEMEFDICCFAVDVREAIILINIRTRLALILLLTLFIRFLLNSKLYFWFPLAGVQR
jgi:hypothetical protein